MFPLFFTIFFAVVSSSDQSICQNRDSFIEESLYKEILFSANDHKVKRKYLQKFGQCITSEGITFTQIKNVPALEILDCSAPLKRNGSEIFFSKGMLCSKSVYFFPSRKVFTVNETAGVILSDSEWKMIDNGGTQLFYHTGTVFRESTDPAGRELVKNATGNFVDKLGKPSHPEFIYESGEWKKVFPLRELFELKVNKDRSFEIMMITESPVSYEPAKLVETTGLKAVTVNIETPVPNNYLITGKEITGVRIPKLVFAKTGENYHGKYIIRLSYSGIPKKGKVVVSEKNYEITINRSEGGMEFILTILTRKLGNEDMTRIKAIINREIPSFYVSHENE